MIIYTWGKSSKYSNYYCLDLVLFHQILDRVADLGEKIKSVNSWLLSGKQRNLVIIPF